MLFSSSNDGELTTDNWSSWSDNGRHPTTLAYPSDFSPAGYHQADQYIPTGYYSFYKDYGVTYTATMTIGQQISFNLLARKCKHNGRHAYTGYVNGLPVNCYIGFFLHPMHIEAV